MMKQLFEQVQIWSVGLMLISLVLTACGRAAAPTEETIIVAKTVSPTTEAPTETPNSPTETPLPPTATPTETALPPTNTPAPTETSIPPTHTPVPTDSPTATPTELPPTSTATATLMPSPPASPTPTVEAIVNQPALTVTWPEQMNYENRTGESLWCQISMTYHNQSDQGYNFPDYQPTFLLFNADGSEVGGYLGNYYRQDKGWPNGISGDPQPIPPASSADWTWYTATATPGQYCGLVFIQFQEWVYGAAYDPQGKLVETDTFPME